MLWYWLAFTAHITVGRYIFIQWTMDVKNIKSLVKSLAADEFYFFCSCFLLSELRLLHFTLGKSIKVRKIDD